MVTSPAPMPPMSQSASNEIAIDWEPDSHAGASPSMAAENHMTRKIGECSVELSSSQVDADADITLKGRVSYSPAVDLRGRTLLIKDQDGALAQSIEFTEFDGETSATSEFVVKAPLMPGTYTWLALCPAHTGAGFSHEEVSASFSFTVKPHNTRIVVWDAPLAIECGSKFSIKFGVKCACECRPDGWALEVRDHDGKKLVRATLSDNAWPDTSALYYTQAEFTAPDTEGLHRWEARAPMADLDIEHTECVASFSVRVVATPECVLTVEAIDRESQAPIKGAKVVVHPYRAITDERGLAQLRLPKGEYRLFVSGKNYFPFRSDSEVKTDMTIRAELALDPGLTDADVYS